MEITTEQASELANQVRQAHRLCVGFYQRLLPSLDNFGSAFQCKFKSWDPLHFNRPCIPSTNPSQKYAWDFVPMVGAKFVYANGEGESTEIGELILEIDVLLDGALDRDYRKNNNIKGQPDSTSIPDAGSYLRVYLYRAPQDLRKAMHELWKSCDLPEIGLNHFTSVGSGLEAIGIKFDLSDFLVSEDELILNLKSLAGLLEVDP